MEIRNVTTEDFDIVFDYVEKLWSYNTYKKEEVDAVYQRIMKDENTFAFLLWEDGEAKGFCHGAYFDTFWLSGKTCYLSSIITNEEERGKGYGIALMDHAKKLAEEAGCKAIVLDSGMPRVGAHRFYEKYGFEKCAYCFELKL